MQHPAQTDMSEENSGVKMKFNFSNEIYIHYVIDFSLNVCQFAFILFTIYNVMIRPFFVAQTNYKKHCSKQMFKTKSLCQLGFSFKTIYFQVG